MVDRKNIQTNLISFSYLHVHKYLCTMYILNRNNVASNETNSRAQKSTCTAFKFNVRSYHKNTFCFPDPKHISLCQYIVPIGRCLINIPPTVYLVLTRYVLSKLWSTPVSDIILSLLDCKRKSVWKQVSWNIVVKMNIFEADKFHDWEPTFARTHLK